MMATTKDMGPLAIHGEWRDAMCHFSHFLNLLWQPLLEYIDSVSSDTDPLWNKAHDVHKSAVGSEIQGVAIGTHAKLDMHAWANFIQSELYRLVKVTVSTRAILHATYPIVPLRIQPTRANVVRFLRSS